MPVLNVDLATFDALYPITDYMEQQRDTIVQLERHIEDLQAELEVLSNPTNQAGETDKDVL
jgi:hypothetical protein